jgi:AcrR family transcriptional regulator
VSDEQQVQRRPGGRSARVVAAVHSAVIELLAQESPDQLTVNQIAERAGVNPTSVYRRWGSLEALVLDVEVGRLLARSPVPDTGSLRGDLFAYAAQAAAEITRAGGLAFLRAVMAMSPDAITRRDGPLQHRAAQIQAMLDRARDRGEHAAQVTDVLDCILAPIYLRAIFGIGGLDDERLAAFVDRALASATP